MKKKIVALILARSGSKRIINKNIKKFKNKPLIYWTIDIAIKSKKFNDVIVSSDSNNILNISKKCNKSVLILKRPKRLSNDMSSSEDAALHAIKWYEKNFFKIDYLSLLQPTSPYRSLKTINTAMNIISNSKINAVISVKKITSKNGENKIFTLTKNNFCKRLKNNNSLKKTFAINGVFYLLKKSFFLNKMNFSPSSFKPIIINSKKENIDIDTKKDWEYAKKFN